MSLCASPSNSVSRFQICNQPNSSAKCAIRRIACVSSPVSKPESTKPTRNPSWKRCEYIDLHNELVPYQRAWDLQKSIVQEKKALIERDEECCDTLIVLQHRPVYTLGTGGSEEFLNFEVRDSPFDVFRTERGGQVTYHGPGQIVMYPIINLRNHKKDLHWYLRNLEEVAIRALSTFSIDASRVEGLTGVWVGDKKLAAIGIRVSQWVAYHGLALNVSMDLSPFRQIVPCGIRDRGVGSIKKVLEEAQAKIGDLSDADDSTLISIAHESLVREFAEVFQLKLEPRYAHTPQDSSEFRKSQMPFGLEEWELMKR